jgi:hypothetical protein
MIFLKISLGTFFFRIMISRWQQRSVYVILFLSTVLGTAYFFFLILWCGAPVKGSVYWPRLISGQCSGPKVTLGMSYAHSTINAATDLALLLLTIPMLIRLQLMMLEKWAVVSIFSIAVL